MYVNRPGRARRHRRTGDGGAPHRAKHDDTLVVADAFGALSPCQDVCRHVALLIRSGEETLIRLADDSGRPVSLEPFGTGVPAHHQTVRVEHVDRVFRYRIHKEMNAISIGLEAGGFGRTGRHCGHPWKTTVYLAY